MVRKLSFVALALGVFSVAIIIPQFAEAQVPPPPRTSFVCGDLNTDNLLTPADIVLEQNYVFLGQIPPDITNPLWAGDINGDSNLTPADVVGLINMVFLGQPLGCNQSAIVTVTSPVAGAQIPQGSLLNFSWIASSTKPMDNNAAGLVNASGTVLLSGMHPLNNAYYVNASGTFTIGSNIPVGSYRIVVEARQFDNRLGIGFSPFFQIVASSTQSIPPPPTSFPTTLRVPTISNDATIKSLQDTIALLTKQLTSLIAQVNALNSGKVQPQSYAPAPIVEPSPSIIPPPPPALEVSRPAGPYGCGDFTGDQRITQSDIDALKNYIFVGPQDPITTATKADINNDGSPTPADLVVLMNYLAGLTSVSEVKCQALMSGAFILGPSIVTAGVPSQWTFGVSATPGRTLQYNLSWGDDPANITSGSITSGEGGITLSHTYQANTGEGNGFTIEFSVSNGITSVIDRLRVTVLPFENQPPTIQPLSGPSTIQSGQSGTWKTVATDPDGGPLSYTIYWGDGSGSQASVASGATISGTHTYYSTANVTRYPYVAVTDDHRVTVQSPTISVTVSPAVVANQPPTITQNLSGLSSVQSGQSGTWTAKATDPEGGTLTYTVYWGDGQTSQGTVASGGTISGTHTYFATANTTRYPYVAVTDNQGVTTQGATIPVNIYPVPSPKTGPVVDDGLGATTIYTVQSQIQSIADQLQAIMQILGIR